ncbi:cytochrome-c oxidase, cbb3-type subunit III [Mesorhizobium sp. BR1-1-16]|uniref:cytochrome-c oxidase, cbb3-type subunit III n=1 Tax=Mesorhizobium sp. BR1-1-16 TaxID=2876653 RepID=UPI001CCC7593|nr:cytochrome-c oxidase, cbb3-type subunit III [Mesorhizobium sp. BR1-1-16]MBZ9936808.1 cytochrome-c oxidase, cbb3-type subunit III [Mesorhizobium sp. BR1-1-16]
MRQPDVDHLSGIETTGHEWDGIKELNNPLPRWWLWTFYACIAFALVYSVLFPAWPLITGPTTGLLRYSTRAEFQREVAAAQSGQAANLAKIAAMPVAAIAADPALAAFASAGGASAFKVYCSQCHGSGAEGGVGYPNLNDDEWIWGGSIDQIYATITHGARSAADGQSHDSVMPNFGSDGILTRDQIRSVALYVASLSGLAGGEKTPEGEQIFVQNCAACHGPDAKGLQAMGGPDLTNAIWLYHGSVDGIVAQINHPRLGMMPAWGAKLGDVTVKELAVYVHGLGGGT